MLYYNGQKVSAKSKLEVEYVIPEIDSVPTEGSENPVTSGGVYEALQNVDATVAVDNQVTKDSENPVSGGAVYSSLYKSNGTPLYVKESNTRPIKKVTLTKNTGSGMEETRATYSNLFSSPYNELPSLYFDASAIGADVSISQLTTYYDYEYHNENALLITFSSKEKIGDFRDASRKNYDFTEKTINLTSVIQKTSAATDAVIEFDDYHAIIFNFKEDGTMVMFFGEGTRCEYNKIITDFNVSSIPLYFWDVGGYIWNPSLRSKIKRVLVNTGAEINENNAWNVPSYTGGTEISMSELYSKYVEIYFSPLE